MASHDVTFKWNEGTTQRKQYVKALSSAKYYGVLAVPRDQLVAGQMPRLDIEAFNPSTNERVLLNGDEKMKFWLSDKRTRYQTVYVEPSCKLFLLMISPCLKIKKHSRDFRIVYRENVKYGEVTYTSI